jgi:3-hydroxy-9,10-secoandrosta-1,3,5(10)-triene-9,17-dione monooxygenase reductase component
MSDTAAFDSREFRRALGTFATGVTIITTRAEDGKPLGLTCNSFNSVSLNPPLVLWSLESKAMSLPVFRAAPYWAVHVLAANQEDLSARFARRGEDKFSGLDVDEGVGGIPLLKGCTARFQCRTASQYEGGDHVIFIGEVLSFDRSDASPLVFHGGRYALAATREASAPRRAYLAGSFGEDFLGYLLGRTHFQFFAHIRPLLAEMNLTDEEFYVLSTLTLKRIMSAAELEAALAGALHEGVRDASASLQALIRRGLVAEAPVVAEAEMPEYRLTEDGTAAALHLIAAAKAVESQALERLGVGEAMLLKSLLNRLIGIIDPAAGNLWGNEGQPQVKRR